MVAFKKKTLVVYAEEDESSIFCLLKKQQQKRVGWGRGIYFCFVKSHNNNNEKHKWQIVSLYTWKLEKLWSWAMLFALCKE